MKKLVIVGAGNPEVITLIEEINKEEKQWAIKGFIDDSSSKCSKIFMGYPILGKIDLLKKKEYRDCYVINTVARDTLIRKKVSERLEDLKIKFATIIHPSVNTKYVEIGEDTLIYKNVILSPLVKIGKHCIIAFNSLLAHETVVGNFVFISALVGVASRCKINDGVFIGTGADIMPRRIIGEWSIVGVGAVVIKDVPAYATVIGNPAQIIYSRKQSD